MNSLTPQFPASGISVSRSHKIMVLLATEKILVNLDTQLLLLDAREAIAGLSIV